MNNPIKDAIYDIECGCYNYGQCKLTQEHCPLHPDYDEDPNAIWHKHSSDEHIREVVEFEQCPLYNAAKFIKLYNLVEGDEK